LQGKVKKYIKLVTIDESQEKAATAAFVMND
jgi:hypothetical protein